MKTVFFYWKPEKKDPAWYTKDAEACNRGYYSFLDWKSSHSVWTWFNKNLLFPVWCPFFAPLLSTEFTSSTWKIAFLCRTNSWQMLHHQSCRACKRTCSSPSLRLLHHCSFLGLPAQARAEAGVVSPAFSSGSGSDPRWGCTRFSGAIGNFWMGRSLDIFRKTLQ